MHIDAVVFDLGGTLLEYAGTIETWPELEGPGLAAAHGYLASSGISLPDTYEFQKSGFELLPTRWQMATSGKRNLTVPSLLEAILDEYSIAPPGDEILREAAFHYQRAVCSGVSPIPGGIETLESLKGSGFKLGLVSNTMFDGQMHVDDMRRYDLAGFFDAMVFSADVNKWKPNLAVFNHILEELDVQAERAVFIGDDPNVDVAGGKNSGLYTIHFRSSQRFSPVDGLVPDAVIHSLAEVPPLISGLNRDGR